MNSAYNLSNIIENVQNGGKFPFTTEYALQENHAGRMTCDKYSISIC